MFRRWVIILGAALLVGTVGVKAHDWLGVVRPCAQCKRERIHA